MTGAGELYERMVGVLENTVELVYSARCTCSALHTLYAPLGASGSTKVTTDCDQRTGYSALILVEGEDTRISTVSDAGKKSPVIVTTVPAVQPDVVLATVRAHPEAAYTMGLAGIMVNNGPPTAVEDKLR